MFLKYTLAAAVIVSGSFAISAKASPVQTGRSVFSAHHHAVHHHNMVHQYRERNGLHGDRGTGYHGKGTATGGPVGGLPNRN